MWLSIYSPLCLLLVLYSSFLVTLKVVLHAISFSTFSGSMVDSVEMTVSYCHSPMLHIFRFP